MKDHFDHFLQIETCDRANNRNLISTIVIRLSSSMFFLLLSLFLFFTSFIGIPAPGPIHAAARWSAYSIIEMQMSNTKVSYIRASPHVETLNIDMKSYVISDILAFFHTSVHLLTF
ncbi:hypothetical protein H5410_026442 [Solanum commersonii]|uniref:Uncharacterized protein n=1 Tax=Solanum commersonii TaxID=4109 RepID=A0A9J5Z1J8_SOLCO|nr:hypothetical protein H5410_026442 [Solanum commersonii]